MKAKKKPKAMLVHPRDDAPEIAKKIWYASGPGRAWKWEQWALKIKQDDRLFPLAQDVIRQVREIRHCYKKGADAFANLLVERLSQTRFAAPLIKHAKDITRGLTVKKSAKAGHEARYGTEKEKQARWRLYQDFIDGKKRDNPSLSYTRRAALAAEHFRVSLKTITRHTQK